MGSRVDLQQVWGEGEGEGGMEQMSDGSRTGPLVGIATVAMIIIIIKTNCRGNIRVRAALIAQINMISTTTR